MGGKGSKRAFSRLTSVFSSTSEPDQDQVNDSNARRWASPFVLTRKSSLYIDEDGDVAHEFYEEVPEIGDNNKVKMRKITSNLRPKGEVHYEFPRLHVDLPIVIAER